MRWRKGRAVHTLEEERSRDGRSRTKRGDTSPESGEKSVGMREYCWQRNQVTRA